MGERLNLPKPWQVITTFFFLNFPRSRHSVRCSKRERDNGRACVGTVHYSTQYSTLQHRMMRRRDKRLA